MNVPEFDPITLPEGWYAEPYTGFESVIVHAVDAEGKLQGYVTVSERMRGFALGISVITRYDVEKLTKAGVVFAGRNWKRELYLKAVEALKAAVSGVPGVSGVTGVTVSGASS